MTEYVAAAGAALWLGILTAISPCPLSTNIAAISFISQRLGKTGRVVLSGMLYTLGRTLAYVILATLLAGSILSAPNMSYLLQKYINMIMGPVLILAGMFLLDLLQFGMGGRGVSARLQHLVERSQIWGPLLLGCAFALSFCPVSAALFFLSLIPLAVKYNSSITFSLLYGVGTAVPVVIFALLIAWGSQSLGRVFDTLSKFERWARIVTGIAFVGVGVVMCLTYIWGV